MDRAPLVALRRPRSSGSRHKGSKARSETPDERSSRGASPAPSDDHGPTASAPLPGAAAGCESDGPGAGSSDTRGSEPAASGPGLSLDLAGSPRVGDRTGADVSDADGAASPAGRPAMLDSPATSAASQRPSPADGRARGATMGPLSPAAADRELALRGSSAEDAASGRSEAVEAPLRAGDGQGVPLAEAGDTTGADPSRGAGRDDDRADGAPDQRAGHSMRWDADYEAAADREVRGGAAGGNGASGDVAVPGAGTDAEPAPSALLAAEDGGEDGDDEGDEGDDDDGDDDDQRAHEAGGGRAGEAGVAEPADGADPDARVDDGEVGAVPSTGAPSASRPGGKPAANASARPLERGALPRPPAAAAAVFRGAAKDLRRIARALEAVEACGLGDVTVTEALGVSRSLLARLASADRGVDAASAGGGAPPSAPSEALPRAVSALARPPRPEPRPVDRTDRADASDAKAPERAGADAAATAAEVSSAARDAADDPGADSDARSSVRVADAAESAASADAERRGERPTGSRSRLGAGGGATAAATGADEAAVEVETRSSAASTALLSAMSCESERTKTTPALSGVSDAAGRSHSPTLFPEDREMLERLGAGAAGDADGSEAALDAPGDGIARKEGAAAAEAAADEPPEAALLEAGSGPAREAAHPPSLSVAGSTATSPAPSPAPRARLERAQDSPAASSPRPASLPAGSRVSSAAPSRAQSPSTASSSSSGGDLELSLTDGILERMRADARREQEERARADAAGRAENAGRPATSSELELELLPASSGAAQAAERAQASTPTASSFASANDEAARALERAQAPERAHAHERAHAPSRSASAAASAAPSPPPAQAASLAGPVRLLLAAACAEPGDLPDSLVTSAFCAASQGLDAGALTDWIHNMGSLAKVPYDDDLCVRPALLPSLSQQQAHAPGGPLHASSLGHAPPHAQTHAQGLARDVAGGSGNFGAHAHGPGGPSPGSPGGAGLLRAGGGSGALGHAASLGRGRAGGGGGSGSYAGAAAAAQAGGAGASGGRRHVRGAGGGAGPGGGGSGAGSASGSSSSLATSGMSVKVPHHGAGVGGTSQGLAQGQAQGPAGVTPRGSRASRRAAAAARRLREAAEAPSGAAPRGGPQPASRHGAQALDGGAAPPPPPPPPGALARPGAASAWPSLGGSGDLAGSLNALLAGGSDAGLSLSGLQHASSLGPARQLSGSRAQLQAARAAAAAHVLRSSSDVDRFAAAAQAPADRGTLPAAAFGDLSRRGSDAERVSALAAGVEARELREALEAHDASMQAHRARQAQFSLPHRHGATQLHGIGETDREYRVAAARQALARPSLPTRLSDVAREYAQALAAMGGPGAYERDLGADGSSAFGSDLPAANPAAAFGGGDLGRGTGGAAPFGGEYGRAGDAGTFGVDRGTGGAMFGADRGVGGAMFGAERGAGGAMFGVDRGGAAGAFGGDLGRQAGVAAQTFGGATQGLSPLGSAGLPASLGGGLGRGLTSIGEGSSLSGSALDAGLDASLGVGYAAQLGAPGGLGGASMPAAGLGNPPLASRMAGPAPLGAPAPASSSLLSNAFLRPSADLLMGDDSFAAQSSASDALFAPWRRGVSRALSAPQAELRLAAELAAASDEGARVAAAAADWALDGSGAGGAGDAGRAGEGGGAR